MPSALRVHGIAIYLFLYLPIALLIFFSFNKNPSGTFPITGLTLDWYRQLGSDYFLLNSFDKSAEKIPRERAAAVPYATMGMALGSSAQALLVLGTITQDELDWFAGEQVFIRTRNGRVIRTRCAGFSSSLH